MPAASYPEGSDTNLAGVFLRVLDQLFKVLVLCVASHREDQWAAKGHTQRSEIFEGIISNGVRVQDPSRNERRIRSDKNGITVLLRSNDTIGPGSGSCARPVHGNN